MNTIKQSLITIIICVVLLAGVNFIYAAWSGPPGNPPDPNAPAPINVNTTAQTFVGSKILNVKSDGTGSLGINGALTVNGLGIFNNNVGIGTASPGQKLDVVGTVKMTGFQLGTSATAGYVLTTNASGVGTWQAAAGGGGGTVTNIATGAGLTGGPITITGTISINTAGINVAACTSGTGTGKIYWDTTNNRLGCGTDQTSVGGGITCSGTCSSGNIPKFTGASSVANSQIYDNGTNVGIGTTAPGNKLDVNGNIGLRSRIFPGVLGTENGYSLVHFKGGTDAAGGIVRASKGTDDLGNAPLRFEASGFTFGGGNVNVSGNVSANQFCLPGANPTGGCISTWPSGGGGGGVGGSGTANYVSKWTAGTTLGNSIISDNGTNVGIGTASPGAKLEVAGQVKITGGTPGSAKVLTSDTSGLASWQTIGSALTRVNNWVYVPCGSSGKMVTVQCPADKKVVTCAVSQQLVYPAFYHNYFFAKWVSEQNWVTANRDGESCRADFEINEPGYCGSSFKWYVEATCL